MRPAATIYQFQSGDIERVCKTLSCSRAQLARTLGVSRACVSRWEKGLRAPQGGDAARLRAMAGDYAGPAIDVFDLRAKLSMTQRVFGAQFGVSRQQVQKWESGAAVPHRSHLDKLVKLAIRATARTPPVAQPDMLTVSDAATFAKITEKTIRKAIKEGRLRTRWTRRPVPGRGAAGTCSGVWTLRPSRRTPTTHTSRRAVGRAPITNSGRPPRLLHSLDPL